MDLRIENCHQLQNCGPRPGTSTPGHKTQDPSIVGFGFGFGFALLSALALVWAWLWLWLWLGFGTFSVSLAFTLCTHVQHNQTSGYTANDGLGQLTPLHRRTQELRT